jgi:hypothetical protein
LHRGLTDGATEETKARYAFVYGDFRRVHRMGLIACHYRAAEWRHKEIELAAHELLQYLDRKLARESSAAPHAWCRILRNCSIRAPNRAGPNASRCGRGLRVARDLSLLGAAGAPLSQRDTLRGAEGGRPWPSASKFAAPT